MFAVVCSKGVISAEWAPSLPVLATEHRAPPALFSSLPNQVCSFSFWMLTHVVPVSERWEMSLQSDLFNSQHRTWAFSWAKTHLCRGAITWTVSEDTEQISIFFSAKAPYNPDQCVLKQRCRQSCLCLPMSSSAEKKEALIRKIYNGNSYTHKLYNNDRTIGIILDTFKGIYTM